MKICVIGYGTVGKAITAAFDKSDELDYDIVDPAIKEYDQDLQEVMQSCDAAVICVPTPPHTDGELDDSIVVSTVDNIAGLGKPILIKSTTDIASLEYFKRMYTNVCYSPEFLRNDHAAEDFLQEEKFIIGGEMDQVEGWANVFVNCQPIFDVMFIDIVEAGYVKFAENAFLAMRVTFFNDLFNLMQKASPQLNYDSVVYSLGLDKRIGHSHNQVPGPDGKFGWGGHCLPKDVQGFLHWANRNGTDLPLLSAVQKINQIQRNR